jgi:uncharacterized protein
MYNRILLDMIRKWLDRPEIIVVTGSRQTGKTFLVKNMVPKHTTRPIRYYNFEDFELRELFTRGPMDFVRSISDRESIYVFDEFQKMPEFTSALKVLYDRGKEKMPKIFLTGSSSPEIQKKFSQSLAGQCLVFNLFSLSFLEKYSLEGKDFLAPLLEGEKDPDIEALKAELFFQQHHIRGSFDEYLLEGGYPELGELAREQRGEKLKSIIHMILEKDLQSLIKTEHLFSSKKLLEILAYRTSNLISFENLASEMQLNVKTIHNLIAVFEGLFFVELIYPRAHFAHEYRKAPKVYFHDLGIRNELVKMRTLPSDKAQMGGLVENFIFAQLKRYTAYRKDFSINYWQDYNKNEVDFILTRGDDMVSIEVKYRRGQQGRLSAGVRNFIARYHPRFHIVVTRDYFGEAKCEKCTIYFLPSSMFGMLV